MALSGRKRSGDVAGGEGSGGLDGGVGDFHIVVVFVLALDAVEDGYGHIGVGFFYADGLQPAFQGRVALDIFAVVVQGGGADALDFAAGQGGFEDVGGVHGAFGGAGADQGVDFVDEQDAVAGVFDFLDDFFEAFLELAAVFGAGHQGAHIQGNQALALQGVGDVAGGYLLGHSLDDGGFADAGFADQDRVVLGAAAEDLGYAFNFGIAPDDRVEFAAEGGVGQVDAELVEGGGAGAGAGAAGAAAAGVAEDAVGFGAHFFQVDAEAFEDAGGDAFAFAEEADEEVFGADVGVVHPPGFVDGQFHHFFGAGGEADFALGGALAASDDEFNGGAHFGEVDAQAGQHSRGDALGFPHQPQQDVFGADVVVVEPLRFFLGEGQNPARPF